MTVQTILRNCMVLREHPTCPADWLWSLEGNMCLNLSIFPVSARAAPEHYVRETGSSSDFQQGIRQRQRIRVDHGALLWGAELVDVVTDARELHLPRLVPHYDLWQAHYQAKCVFVSRGSKISGIAEAFYIQHA